MSEMSPEPERMAAISEAILQDCRENINFYDSPSGFGIDIAGVNWQVAYWPSWVDREGVHEGRVYIHRDFLTHKNPAMYTVKTDGTISKNETVAKRIYGGVYYDPEAVHLVEDIYEANLLLGIVRATHHTKRNS